MGREPLFPFGHGLGYAVTEIAGARLIDHHTVEVDVSNTSDREGYEVVQVYAHRVDRAGLEPDEPAQRLVGFTNVAVPANGRSTAAVALDRVYQGWDVAVERGPRSQLYELAPVARAISPSVCPSSDSSPARGSM